MVLMALGKANATAPEAGPAEVRRWRQRLADERVEASLYRNLAARQTGEDREILLAIAEAEERHIAHWEGLLGGAAAHAGRADLRLRLLALLARRFGSVFVLALAQRADRKSTRLNSSHSRRSRMPSSA